MCYKKSSSPQIYPQNKKCPPFWVRGLFDGLTVHGDQVGGNARGFGMARSWGYFSGRGAAASAYFSGLNIPPQYPQKCRFLIAGQRKSRPIRGGVIRQGKGASGVGLRRRRKEAAAGHAVGAGLAVDPLQDVFGKRDVDAHKALGFLVARDKLQQCPLRQGKPFLLAPFGNGRPGVCCVRRFRQRFPVLKHRFHPAGQGL